MILADIVQAVQDDVSDATTTIPVSKINRYVDRACRDVQRELLIHGVIAAVDGTVTITTDGTTTAYTLAITDPIMVTSVVQVDSAGFELCPAEQIDKKDRFDYSVWDSDRQCWRYWLTRNAGTGNWLINFNGSPSSGTLFRVDYSVEDAAAADVLLTIPASFHELVVAKATLGLFGPDPSLGAFAAARYSELRQQMFALTSARSGNNEVIRDG